MDCDWVFGILTRGPFPTGDPSDRLVEMHLSECYECYRLAEALRPAAHLTHESITPEESRDLPGYWGDLSGAPMPEAVGLILRPRRPHRAAERPLRRELRSVEVKPTPARWQVNLAVFAGATLLGALMALALHAMGFTRIFEPTRESSAPQNVAAPADAGDQSGARGFTRR